MKSSYINVFYSEEYEGYIADIPDLEDCSAFGKTLQEALRQILIVKAARLEGAEAESKPVPSLGY